jgi:hypothetical protein
VGMTGAANLFWRPLEFPFSLSFSRLEFSVWGGEPWGEPRLAEFQDDNFHFTPELPSVRSADAFRIGWFVCWVPWGDGVRV